MPEEKGFDVVVDASNTVFFKPALEITADALAAYDKAYPAKVGGASYEWPATSTTTEQGEERREKLLKGHRLAL